MRNNLLELTRIKNCSVKNIKEEAALVAVHNLLGQYINAIEKGIDKPLISNPDQSDEKYILELTKDIHSYLSEEILSAHIIDNIMLSANKNAAWQRKVSLIEPIAYFYDILTRTYLSKTYILKKDKDGNQFWMPELLAFSIICDLKEENYNFNKFEYIQNLELSKVMDIYNNLSIKISRASKNEDESFFKLQKNSPIKAIQEISLFMVNKLIDTKYKVPSVSKNMKKRNKKNGRKRK